MKTPKPSKPAKPTSTEPKSGTQAGTSERSNPSTPIPAHAPAPARASGKSRTVRKAARKAAEPAHKPHGLNLRQERFAELVAGGMPASRAYQAAGYVATGNVAESSASQLLRIPKVSLRIAMLRRGTETKAEYTRLDLVRLLASALETPIGEIDEKSPLAQEMVEDVIGGGRRGKLRQGHAEAGNETVTPLVMRRRVKSMGKIEAARLLAEIMGWKSPDQLVVETGPKTLESIAARADSVAAALDRNATHRARSISERPTTGSGLSRWQPAITG